MTDYQRPILVNVKDYGAISDGSTDCTSAIGSAYNALPSTGGTLLFPDGGSYIVSNLTFTKPTRIHLGRCGITQKTGATGAMITASANLVLAGHSQYESTLTANSGQTAVLVTGYWNSYNLPGLTGDLGTQVFLATNCNFVGGAHSLDTSGLLFSQGLWAVENCRFYGTTSQAINLIDNVSYSAIAFCQFSQCNGSMFIGQNTETKCYANQHAPVDAATNPNVTLEGCHHVQIEADTFQGSHNYYQPDILVYGALNAASGYAKIINNNFAPEREYAWSKSRPRILNYDSANPTFSAIDFTIKGNHFYAGSIPIMPVASVATTTSAGVPTVGGTYRTLTITLTSGQTDSGIQVGDTFSLIQMTDASFAGGPFTVTHRTANTLTWQTTSSSASQSAGGYVLPGSIAAIEIQSPHGRWDIDDNFFYGYPIIVNDNFQYTATYDLNYVGQSVWGSGNRIYGPYGRGSIEFQNGGQHFTRADVRPETANQPLLTIARSNETVGLLNRAYPSETPAAGTGMTVTTGVTDPYGTTRAVTLTRAGVNLPWKAPGLGEIAAVTIDIGATIALPTNPALSFLTFWAQKGGANSSDNLEIYIAGNSATTLVFQDTVTLGANWKKYIIPIVWPSTPSSILGTLSDVLFAPGAGNIEPTSCNLFGVALCDYIPCDYIPTTSAPLSTTSLGNRFELGQQHAYLTASEAVVTDANKNLASLVYTSSNTASTLVSRDSNGAISAGVVTASGIKITGGGTPSISGVGAGIGSTGTVTLDTGSTDESGIIVLNPLGSGITNVLSLNFTFSASLPGNTPVVDFQLIDGAANWGTGVAADLSTVRAFSLSNSGFSLIASNQHWTGSTLSADAFSAGAAQYKIAYRVTFK